MSISDNYVPVKQIGNGSTTEFSGNWAVLNASFLNVALEDVTTGVQTPQTNGADYSLTFDASGFVVTMFVAPTSANYVVISRSVDQTQTDPYRTSKGFQGEVVEDSFDKITAIAQDLQDQIDRSPKTQVGSDPLTFPPYNAGLYLGWSSTVDGTVVNGTKTIAQVDAAVDLVNAVTSGSGVLVSSSDTTIGFLNTKLIAGSAITLTINNPSGVETLTIDVDAATTTAAGIVEAATTAEMTAGTANKFPDAAKVKTYVDAIAGIIGIGTSVTPNAVQAIPNSTWTAIDFQTEDFDDNDWHDDVTNNSRITVDTTGRYICSGQWEISNNGNGDIGIAISVNGTREVVTRIDTGTTGDNKRLVISYPLALTANDYVELEIFQTTGSSQNTVAAGTNLTVLRVK